MQNNNREILKVTSMDNEKSLAEITIKAVVLGVVLSMVLAAANAYLGLFAGMTVSASIPAAVISMGILRIFRNSNVLENNIVQTAASAGESLAAGVIFTFPALVLIGYWTEFNFWWVTIIAGLGGVLGVLFTIPLRRALIVEENLKFPEGIATAEVLKSGERKDTPADKAKSRNAIKCIIQGALGGGLFKLGAGGLCLWPEVLEGARRVGGSVAYFGSNLSPALMSVGFIVGINTAILIFVGGALNWFVAIPICAVVEGWPVAADGIAMGAVEGAYELWSTQTRYIGVGAMLIGGLWTVVEIRKSLFSGVISGLKACKSANQQAVERHEKDMPMKWVIILIVAAVVPLFLVYQHFVRDMTVSIPMAALMILLGFLFSAVAGYMAGIVGSSNNPISGVTIATVLVCSLLILLLMGRDNPSAPAFAIIIGSVVCCAAAIAGDNMQDLKAGYILKATPWKQQVMQIVGTVSSALVMAPVLSVLLKAYGFEGHASAKAGALAAPQAQLIASVAKGVFEGNLPWNYIYVGMVFAAIIIFADSRLKAAKSTFRLPVLAVAIGVYLPLELSVPIFAGGLISLAIKAAGKVKEELAGGNGLLFASGLITGEALVGISMAVVIVISGKGDILAIADNPLGAWPGLILLGGIGYWLYSIARKDQK